MVAEGDVVALQQDVRRAVIGPQFHAVPVGGHEVGEDVHIAVAAALHMVAVPMSSIRLSVLSTFMYSVYTPQRQLVKLGVPAMP